MSMISSCSVDSDWSDEELEELEKMFGNIQHKSSMAAAEEEDNQDLDEEATAISEAASESSSSLNKWRRLKRSRRLAMAKLQQQKNLKRLPSNISTTSSRERIHSSSVPPTVFFHSSCIIEWTSQNNKFLS